MTFLLRCAGWLAVGLIGLLSLVPAHFRPHLLPNGQIEHLLAYALVGAFLALIYCDPKRAITISVALPVAAAALEFLQNWSPGRDPKLSDVIASSMGAWIGIACVIWLRNLRPVATLGRRRTSTALNQLPEATDLMDEGEQLTSSPVSATNSPSM